MDMDADATSHSSAVLFFGPGDMMSTGTGYTGYDDSILYKELVLSLFHGENMDIVFPTRPTGEDTINTGSIAYDHAQLLLTLHQAARHADSSGHATLANFTQPIAPCDPLRIFTAFQHMTEGESFFWARPAEQRALVGLGTATTIETSGPTCVAAAAASWRQVQHHATINAAPGNIPTQTAGPVFFGGFRFDPLSPRTALWEAFPDGLLILPRLLFHCDETSTALTYNVMVQPSTDCEQIANAFATMVQNLETQLAHLPQQAQAAQKKLQQQSLLTPETWMAQVAETVEMIQAGAFEKVALARAIQVTNTEQAFDIFATLERLRTSYPSAHIFAIERGRHTFVGATPERLVCGADGQIQTMALAGSAPRGATAAEDAQIGDELLLSTKNRGEHRVVVDTIRKALSNICSRVWVADAPHLLRLKNIQHLETPIIGDLLPGHSILEAIEDLHPTPAVGGFPRQPALDMIRTHEHLDRGWYAAPIGWVGNSGNGEFAVALRSALIDGQTATLFAGCGIMADSQPESELAESGWKLEVMLNALADEEQV